MALAEAPTQRQSPGHSEFGRVTGLIFIFLATRILIGLSMTLEQVSFVANDVGYYAYYLFRMANGEGELMVEYPVPAVWILQALYFIGGGYETWVPLYVTFFLLLDGAVAASLYRRGNAAGSLFWILFTGAQGAIVWYRFDLIPAALVAWACVLLMSRPRVAGGLIGFGAAIKLWPALLIAPMLAPNPLKAGPARRRLFGFVAVGSALAAASLLTSGWARSASPIGWQSGRGLQIESVPATPLMWLRTFTDNPSWPIALSEYNALELDRAAPGVELMLQVSSVLTAASIALAIFLTYRLIRNLDREDPRLRDAIILAVFSIVLATIIANKTLSPQYLVWLGGPVAALLVNVRTGWLKRHVQVLAASLVVLAGCTQFTYPWGTYGIMSIPLGSGPETSVLVLRNIGLVALTCYAIALTLMASTRGSRPESHNFG